MSIPVTTEIKHLVFKGIEKKEQILFKSFLNLAKNELEYQVVILKQNSDFEGTPNIVIADSSYQFTSDEKSLDSLPTIRVGNELGDAAGYIARPVQWSDFKTELTRLDLDAVAKPLTSGQQVLPKNMEFAIVEMDQESESPTQESGEFTDADEFDYELDNLSIDYHSFTNSEYMKVVDDLKGFKDGDEGIDLSQAVVLITDDESASNNSVLIIETNSLDAWEMSESEIESDTGKIEASSDPIESDSSYVDVEAEAQLTKRLASGSVVKPGNQFWLENAEIYSEREQLLVVKPDRDRVYSDREPGKWTAAIRKKAITKCPLAATWRPSDQLKSFPISRLVWANTIATKGGGLARGLDSQTEYILERWPHFDLLELDNMLLKLCTMLFVQAESPYSLMQKSGYSRSVVYSLVNACHELDILRVSADFDLEKFSQANAAEGVFGKIKDVFRT
ncbi:MAG: hypothetical protein ACJAQ6_000819 [Arenicella sp.]|jgi:hypothetical protein